MHIFVVYTCYHMLYCEICREVEKNICCATCWFSAAVMLLFSFVCLSAFDQVFLCHGQVVVLFFFFFIIIILSCLLVKIFMRSLKEICFLRLILQHSVCFGENVSYALWVISLKYFSKCKTFCAVTLEALYF